MSYHSLPRFYYHKDITSLVEWYVESGHRSYRKLDIIDKEKLAATCINILGDDAYSCIIEPEEFSLTLQNLKKYLFLGQKEYAIDLAENMKLSAVKYFEEDLDELFAEKTIEYEQRWNDYYESWMSNQVPSPLFFI
jgi:hypothetical protein